jgi:SPP1 gp7 family putative phage head morphogenesis protein
VTTPAAPQPPPPPGQQPPPQQPPAPVPPATIPPATLAAMALPLAGLLLTAASAAVVVAALKLRFKLGVLSALFWLAMLMVLSRIVMAHPPPVTGFAGPAGARVSRMNMARRAQFAIAAAHRVMSAMLAARAHGEPVIAAGRGQVERERRYYQQHLEAMWNRAQAAMAVDMQAAEHGNLLGWLARRDNRVTPECKWASGKNFYADDPPYIGLPGVGPHVGCRCKAVAPWPGGELLPGSGPRYARAA